MQCTGLISNYLKLLKSPQKHLIVLQPHVRNASNRPNLQRPLPVHYNRKRVLAVCEPVLPPKPEVCQNLTQNVDTEVPILDDNPYALYLANKLRRDLANHEMVAVFHCNVFSASEFLNILGMLYDNEFPMRLGGKLNNKVAKAALTGTRWEPVLPLCVSHTMFGFCQTNNVSKLLKVLKKMPSFILIGLIYENKLLHKDDVDKLEKYGSIVSLHSSLSTQLTLPMSSLSQHLLSGQMSLAHNLNVYCKENADSSSSSDSDSTSDSSSSSSSDSDNETS